MPGSRATSAAAPLAETTRVERNAGDPDQGALVVEITSSGVSIRADAVSQQTVLYNLASQAGFEITEAGIPWQVVTLEIEARDLHAALVALLKEYPYQIIYEFDASREADTLSRVVVGDPARMRELPPRTPVADATPATAGYQSISPAAGEPLSEEDQVNLTLLLDPSPDVRERAVDDIEPVGIALDYLTQIITTDPSAKVRMAAAWTLEDSADPKAYNALIQALQDKDPEVLEEVIDALGYIDNKTAIPYLQPFLDHPDEDVKSAAEDAIYRLE